MRSKVELGARYSHLHTHIAHDGSATVWAEDSDAKEERGSGY